MATNEKIMAGTTSTCATKKRESVSVPISAPPRKCIICVLIDTPPNNTASLIGLGKNAAKLRKVSPTWVANSRVGTKINTLTLRGVAVVIIHTDADDAIPIISARVATPKERRNYEAS